MSETSRIYAALSDAHLSHSAFRLHVALIAALEGKCNPFFTAVSVPGLRSAVPGTQGKPMSDSVFYKNLNDLQRADLIAVVSTNQSRVFLLVKLLDRRKGADRRLKDLLRYEMKQTDSGRVDVHLSRPH